MAIERTLVIIKPDAQERGLIGRIISRFEDKNYRVIGTLLTYKDSVWYDKMYNHLNGNIYKLNMEFMLAAPLLGLVLSGEDVVFQVRNIVGANSEVPGTIRGDFGSVVKRYNCVHASDSVEQADKEIAWFFGDDND